MLLQSHLTLGDPMHYSPARFLCPWDSPGKNTGVGCHALLQWIFPTPGSNPHFLGHVHWQVDSLPRSHLGSPLEYEDGHISHGIYRQWSITQSPKQMSYQATQRCGGTLNAYRYGKEANLRTRHTVSFELYAILQKGKAQ